jgi:hypothetical protein
VATGPIKGAGDDGNPLTDLLFSPRPALIWNNEHRAFIWMNRAAREKLKLTVHELSAALSDAARQQLTLFPAKRRSKRSSTEQLQITVAGALPCLCSMAPLKLAGGHDGVVLAELTPGHAESSPGGAIGTPMQRARSSNQQKANATKPVLPGPPPQTLTPEEWRSFKAIGRKVRKLCREKLQAGASGKAGQNKPSTERPATKPALVSPHLRAILAAFDVFLILDASFRVLKVEGRPRRLGWRKSSFNGRFVTDLLPSSERGIFDRIARRVADQEAQVSRDALLVQNTEGVSWPCRAVLGRWPSDSAVFFLALTSLDVPARLKRLELRSSAADQPARLAA